MTDGTVAPAVDVQGVWRVFPPASGQRTLYRVVRDAVTGVNRRKEPITALQEVTLRAAPGEKIALIGNNGAGKSTLLKVIAGLLRPTRGTVRVQGEMVLLTSLGSGMVDEVTVRDNTLLYGSLYGVKPAHMEELLGDVLEWAGIAGYEDAKLRTLSSGTRQRLAFSVMRHIATDIFLIDEALSAGDVRFRAKCRAFFESDANVARTFLVATHDMDFAQSFCKLALWLDHGRVMDWGESGAVVERYVAAQHGSANGTGAVSRPAIAPP